MEIFDKTLGAIEKSLDLRVKRHAVLSTNIANAETPAYRAREYDFAGELTRALGSETKDMTVTDPGHLTPAGSQMSHVVFDDDGAVRSDGNNVDSDITLGKISENARGYSSAVTMLEMKLRLLKTMISGRG